MPKRKLNRLGWSVGKNKWGDETGTFHLQLVDPNREMCVSACGVKHTAGQIEHDPLPYGYKCRTCKKIDENWP